MPAIVSVRRKIKRVDTTVYSSAEGVISREDFELLSEELEDQRAQEVASARR